MAKKSGFKMKGHTLPGINQKSETKNMADGRSKSSAFQKIGGPMSGIGVAKGAKAGKGMTVKNPNLTTEQANVKKAKLRNDVKTFGQGLKGTAKDIKYGLSGKAGRAKMDASGFENVKTRKAKYGTSSHDPKKIKISRANKQFGEGAQINGNKSNTTPDVFKAKSFKGHKGDPYSYRTSKGGGYEYSKDGTNFTASKGKGTAAIDKLFKEKNDSGLKKHVKSPAKKHVKSPAKKSPMYKKKAKVASTEKLGATASKKSPARNYKKGYYGA